MRACPAQQTNPRLAILSRPERAPLRPARAGRSSRSGSSSTPVKKEEKGGGSQQAPPTWSEAEIEKAGLTVEVTSPPGVLSAETKSEIQRKISNVLEGAFNEAMAKALTY